MVTGLLDTPFFHGIPQRDLDIRQYRAKVPMFFAGARVMGGIFAVDLEAARRLLPDPRFEVATAYPGRALLGIFAFDYGYTDLGPYKEAFVSLSIHFGRSPVPHPLRVANGLLRRTFDGHTIQLPVDSDAARVGGIDLFGVPKYLAGLTFADEQNERVCRVCDERGASVFTLRCPRPTLRTAGRFSPLREQTFRNYAVTERGIAVGRFVLHAPLAGMAVGPRSAVLEPGASMRGEELGELHVAHALGSFVGENCEAILHAPTYL